MFILCEKHNQIIFHFVKWLIWKYFPYFYYRIFISIDFIIVFNKVFNIRIILILSSLKIFSQFFIKYKWINKRKQKSINTQNQWLKSTNACHCFKKSNAINLDLCHNRIFYIFVWLFTIEKNMILLLVFIIICFIIWWHWIILIMII